MCHNGNNGKNVPDEWQGREATPAILLVSSSNHNVKKSATRGAFHQLITAFLTEEKEIILTNLHMLESIYIGT